MRSFIIIFSILFSLIGKAESEIKVLNWWDYISPKVEKNLKEKGYKYTIEEYRSNEVALSKILSSSDKYDVAILSNFALEVLESTGKLNKEGLLNVKNKRKYIQTLKNKSLSCIPYLWAATVFAKKKSIKKLESLYDLAKVKAESGKIAIVDDNMEFLSRWLLDENIKGCPDKKECANRFEKIEKQIDASDFVSSVEDVLLKVDAVYGWHGEISKFVEKNPEFEFSLPKNRTVFGGDFVCLLNKTGRSKRDQEKIMNFIVQLTNKENTFENSKFTTYFSPYVVEKKNKFKSKTQGLYESLVKEINKGYTPFMISKFKTEENEVFNSLWKRIRF